MYFRNINDCIHIIFCVNTVKKLFVLPCNYYKIYIYYILYIILLYVSVSILFDRHFIRLLFRVLVYFKIFTVGDFVQSQIELFFV